MPLQDGDVLKYQSSTNTMVGVPPTTGFTQMTGSSAKGALAPYATQTLNTLVLATAVGQLQTLNDYLVTLSQRVKAHEDALFAAKLISA